MRDRHNLVTGMDQVTAMKLLEQPWPLRLIWLILIGEALLSLMAGRYNVAFTALSTTALTLAPIYSHRLTGVHIPSGFLVAIAIFLFATLFLGEVWDFYERFWWWDVVLHMGSAVGLGLVGVVLMLILVRGDRLRAAPVTVSLFAFCFAIMIGVIWEIFEFAADQLFGFNMQKSGLVDTMWDLIVDCIGAGIGAAAGYLHLTDRNDFALTAMIREFKSRNAHLFR
jgi:hypothetical protein